MTSKFEMDPSIEHLSLKILNSAKSWSKLQDFVVTTYAVENDTTAISRYCFVKFHMFISSPADGLFHEPLCISLVTNFTLRLYYKLG